MGVDEWPLPGSEGSRAVQMGLILGNTCLFELELGVGVDIKIYLQKRLVNLRNGNTDGSTEREQPVRER